MTGYLGLLAALAFLIGILVATGRAPGMLDGLVRVFVTMAMPIVVLAIVAFVAVPFVVAAKSSRPLAWSAAFLLLVGGVPLFALGARAAEHGRPSAKGPFGLLLLVAALACV